MGYLASREHRIPFQLNRWAMGPLPALLLGFTFSFAWTPCVGPTLGSVLLMAGSSGSAAKGFLLIGVYTLGFVLPFLAVGLFTGAVLSFFKAHQKVVRYTVKAGAMLLILMGIMTLTGWMNGVTNYLSAPNSGSESSTSSNVSSVESGSVSSQPALSESMAASEERTSSAEASGAAEEKVYPAPDFTLVDQFGNTHKLSDYRGKTVFLNFWATWCPPCRGEMPDIQALYEKYGKNNDDLIVLGVAGPNVGSEGDRDDIAAFLSQNGYSFPVVMDEGGQIQAQYGISAFPTTFMIDKDGNIFGYVASALSSDIMESIVQQTMSGKRAE